MFPRTVVAPTPQTVALIRGSWQSIGTRTPFAKPVTVEVDVGFGRPVPNWPITWAHPNRVTSLERLERLSDSALYLAKQSGLNRVEVATSTGFAIEVDDAATLTNPLAATDPAAH